jgi:hypothetical protein
MDAAQLIWWLHLAATGFMVGLIWFVQIVHYPLFAAVDPNDFAKYEHRHTSRTFWVVAPPMLIETATAVALVWLRPSWLPPEIVLLGLILVFINAASTAWLQIPCHNRLSIQFDAQVHRRLVQTNWIRTVAWTLRGILLVIGQAQGTT